MRWGDGECLCEFLGVDETMRADNYWEIVHKGVHDGAA